MKLVELTADMRPNRAGDSRLLPDEVADRLIADGLATNPRDRAGNPIASREPIEPLTPAAKPKRPYLTKA